MSPQAGINPGGPQRGGAVGGSASTTGYAAASVRFNDWRDLFFFKWDLSSRKEDKQKPREVMSHKLLHMQIYCQQMAKME